MASINVQIQGLDKVAAEFDQTPDEVGDAMREGMVAVAQLIRGNAVKAIQRGAKTGRVYKKYNPNRVHRASAPGEAPASDLGHLAGSVQAAPGQDSGDGFVILFGSDGLSVDLIARAEYAGYLEYGTSKMAPRPFMQPTVDAFRDQAGQIIADTMRALLKR